MNTPTLSRSVSKLSHKRLLAALASLPLALGLSSAAYAQSTLSWSSAGSATLGGNGTWDTSGANWWNGASAVAWPSTGTANTAVFTGTAGTVTLGSSLSANSLRFTTTNYTLNGSQVLTLNGSSPALDASSGVTATIGGNNTLQIAGSAGLTKTGSGNLTLNSSIAHSITGGINANGGILTLALGNLATPTDLVPATNTLTVGGGTLTVTGKIGAPATQTFANTVLNKGNSQIRVGPPTGGATVTTLNLGAITRSGPGAMVRLNTAAGGFAATASTTEVMKISGPANGTWFAPWALTGEPTSTTVRWAYTDNATGQIRQNGGVTATPTTMANVTSNTTVYTASGTFTPTTGIVALGIQSNGATTYNLNSVSATFGGFLALPANTATNFNTTGGGTIQINSDRELFTAGLGSILVNVPIVDNSGGTSHLTHAGGGSLSLNAANTYTGETNVIGGTLIVAEAGTINSSSGVYVLPGATFRQKNFTTALTPLITLQGGRVEGDGNITNLLVTNLATNTVANVSTSTAPFTINGNLTFQGAGSLSPILRSNSTLTPPYAVGGALTTTPAVAKVTINPVSATGTWSGNATTYNLLSYGSWSGSLSDFVVGTASPIFSARQSAILADTGGMLTLTISPSDNVVWTGAASSNWTTTTVASPYNWSISAGSVGAQFLTGDDIVFNDTAINTNVVISDANVAPNSMLFNNTVDYTVSSPAGYGISSGALTKTGTGRLTLGGNNTTTGLTTITEGSLALGGNGTFQGTNSMFLGSNTATPSGNATFDLNGYNARLISLSSGNSTTNTITNNGSGSGTNTLNLVLPTVALSSLVTDGPTSKVALSLGARAGNPTNGNNTFSGGFLMYGASGGGEAAGCRLSPVAANNPTISSGVLIKGTYGTGNITMGLDIADKAQFYFNTANVTIGNNVIVNSALGTDIVGAFRVEDTGIVVNGSVIANKASVLVHHNGQFSSGPTAGGPLEQGVAIGGQVTFNGPILAGENPAAGLTVQQANLSTSKRVVAVLANTTPTLSNYTGNTTITAANVILRLAAANQIPDGDGKGIVIFSGNSTLDLNDNSEAVNAISGSGFIENISGVNPVTLTVGGGNATGANFSGRIFDARGGALVSLTKIGTGTQILSNANVYSGNTTISGGTLQLGNGGTTGGLLPASTIINNGTLAINRSNAVTQGTDFSGAPITGTGGLTKLGNNTLTLNAANTYSGPTLISAGTLAAAGDASFGATNVTLTTNSTLDITGLTAGSLTLSGGLGGNGTINATGKTLTLGATFTPGALAVTGNLSLGAGLQTTLLATASPATNSTVTVTGSVANNGTLVITPGSGFSFAGNQTFTFVSATGGITSGFTGVNVGGVTLTSSTSGTWTGSNAGLGYNFVEGNATLTVSDAPAYTPLQSWRLENFGSIDDSGNGANTSDPDGDGVNNLLEYALNGNPNIANSTILPQVTGTGPLKLSFYRNGDANITYIVEARDDLVTGSWVEKYNSFGTAYTPGLFEVVDSGQVGTKRFMRLRVTTN